MLRTHAFLPLASLLALATAPAQVLLSPNTTTDTVWAFDLFDGHVIDADYFPISTTGGNMNAVVQVENELWLAEAAGDRIVRYDPCGNQVGVIGPTFPGGGFDNLRSLLYLNGIVYVCNDGSANGATMHSLVAMTPTGVHIATYPLSASSPFALIPFQGDLLVASDTGADDVHRYTAAGVSVGTFHDSASLDFVHQINTASDGNVWCSCFSTNNVVKLDATNGSTILTSFAASGARGVYELGNGNVMWTSGSGARIYDPSTLTSTLVASGSFYHLNPVLPQQGACHKNYGAGCHAFSGDRSNLFEFFASVAAAKTALDGNAIDFALTANGYTATWLPGVAGALYVPPSIGAPVIANADSTTAAIVASAPIPIPGGTEQLWTVSSNGILTAGGTGNQGTSGTPTLASTATQTGLAFYTWANHNPAETGSGKITWEEASGLLLVTFNGVEFSGGTPTLSPSTFQFQIDMTTGSVRMLWTSFSGSNSTSDVLVGCTLAGAAMTPVSASLASPPPYVLQPDTGPMLPLALSASPSPVINPSTNVTWTATNVPEFSPGSGQYFGALFFSLNPFPTGLDLVNILTTVPGCSVYMLTLDANIGAFNSVPVLTWNLNFSTPTFQPGNVIATQAVAIFDPAFPLLNGESGGYLLSNAVHSSVWPQ